jgi:hypothetical protein
LRFDAHLPAGFRFGDQPAQALGGEAIKIALTGRRGIQQRPYPGFQSLMARLVQHVFDDDASLRFQNFVDDPGLFAPADGMKTVHAGSFCCSEQKARRVQTSKKSRDLVIFISGAKNILSSSESLKEEHTDGHQQHPAAQGRDNPGAAEIS